MNKHLSNQAHTSIEQITINATSWIGNHPKDNKEVGRGQTFIANTEGNVDAIEVYTNIVTKPGHLLMTIHSFDPQKKSWGPALGTCSVECDQDDSGKWMAFNIPSLHLNKGESYGFRLECPDSFIGVGEAAGSSKHPPFITGQEWHFSNNNQKADAFTYFSLAFKFEIKA